MVLALPSNAEGSQLWCLHYTSVLHNCTSSGLEEIVANSKDSNQVTSRCLVLYLNVPGQRQQLEPIEHLVYPSMRGAHACCCPSLVTQVQSRNQAPSVIPSVTLSNRCPLCCAALCDTFSVPSDYAVQRGRITGIAVLEVTHIWSGQQQTPYCGMTLTALISHSFVSYSRSQPDFKWCLNRKREHTRWHSIQGHPRTVSDGGSFH